MTRLSFFWKFVGKWNSDNAGTMGAALSFYSVFSLLPLLIIFISIASIMLDQSFVEQEFFARASAFIGKETASTLFNLLKDWDNSPYFGLPIGILLLVFGASGTFNHLQKSLNIIFKSASKGGWRVAIRKRLIAFGVLLGVGFLLLVSLLISWYIARISVIGKVTLITDFIGFLALSTILFAMLFRALPSKKMPMRYVWMGSFITGLLFGVGRYAISTYIASSRIAGAFGAASFVLILLLWIYYTSIIFFAGAELIYLFYDRKI